MQKLVLILLLAFFSTQSYAEENTPVPELKPLPPQYGVGTYLGTLELSYFPPVLQEAAKQLQSANHVGALETTSLIRTKDGADKLHLVRALAYQALNQHQSALSEFGHTLELRGSSSDVYFFMAFSYLAQSDWDKALAAFDDALWFGKHAAISKEKVLFSKAMLYRMKSDIPKAAENLQAALASNNAFAPARSELASLELERGNRAQAIVLLRESLAKTPDDFDSQLRLAQALLQGTNRILNRTEITEANGITSKLFEPNKLADGQRQALIPVYVHTLLAVGDIERAQKLLSGELKRNPQLPDASTLQQQIALEQQSKNPSVPPQGAGG